MTATKIKKVDIPSIETELKKKTHTDYARDLLIEAAKRLFANYGFEGATTKNICDEAGVNVSLISYHFGGKEGLYRACLDQFGISKFETIQRMLKPADSEESFKLRLSLFIDEMISWYIDEPYLMKIVYHECEMDTPHAEDVFRKTFMGLYKVIEDFFVESKKRKLIREDIDAHAAAYLFLGHLVFIQRMDLVSERFLKQTVKDPAYREKIAQQILDINITGLLPHKN